MMEFEEDFREMIKQLRIPEDVLETLTLHGYDCTLTFGLAFSSITMLDQHLSKFLPEGDHLPHMCSHPCSLDQVQQLAHGTYRTSSTSNAYTSCFISLGNTQFHPELA